MSIFEAVTAGVKTMADDTLRLTIDIEPRFAAEAFALFGVRGRAVAVTALKDGAGKQSDAPVVEKPAAEKLGPLAMSAVKMCGNPDFAAYAMTRAGFSDPAEYVKRFCVVSSRRDIDGDPDAARIFKEMASQFRRWTEQRAAERSKEAA